MWIYQPFPGVSLAGSFTFARMAIALFAVCHFGILKNKKKEESLFWVCASESI